MTRQSTDSPATNSTTAENDFNTIKQEADLVAWCDTHLERRGKQNYVCPWCNSGHKKNGTAAGFVFTGVDGVQRYKCQSCNKSADIIDLVGEYYHIDNKREQVLKAAADCNITLAGAFPLPVEKEPAAQQAPQEQAQPDEQVEPVDPAKRAKMLERLKVWQEAMNPTCEAWQYLTERGFSDEDIKRFKFGYDAHNTRGLVIPYDTHPETIENRTAYYIRRNLKPCAHDERYRKPGTGEVGEEPLMNPTGPSIWQEPAILIVEGALDVYAALSVGVPAVAIVTTGATKAAKEEITAAGYKGDIIAALDMDAEGRKGQERLMKDLREAGLNVYPGELPEQYKDLGDALAVSHTEVKKCCEAMLKNRYNDRLMDLHVKNMTAARENVLTLKNYEAPLSTGFSELDKVLNGGTRRGQLITIGAPSSMGKTTLTHQWADNLATAGTKVLFVTCEQSADELMAKSLTRIYSTKSKIKAGQPIEEGLSADELTNPEARAGMSPEALEKLRDAAEDYRVAIEPNLYVLEADTPPAVAEIYTAAETLAKRDGLAPIVFVDYLQLLAPVDEKDTDKRITDKNMTALRLLAKSLHTTVIVISSLNRAGYDKPVTMASFKESGSIEYSSDVLLGMQPYHFEAQVARLKKSMEYKANQAAEAEAPDQEAAQTSTVSTAVATQIVWDYYQRENPREVGITVLKNRTGKKPDDEAHMDYYPALNRFVSNTSSHHRKYNY